jgi:hypothetical protein
MDADSSTTAAGGAGDISAEEGRRKVLIPILDKCTAAAQECAKILTPEERAFIKHIAENVWEDEQNYNRAVDVQGAFFDGLAEACGAKFEMHPVDHKEHLNG